MNSFINTIRSGTEKGSWINIEIRMRCLLLWYIRLNLKKAKENCF